ncbi:hypothetical protein IJ596_06795 [bacterium]|nr:hypothetical protein [bacterium]
MTLNTITENNHIVRTQSSVTVPSSINNSYDNVIDGPFYYSKPPLTLRDAVTRKINKTLCIFLLITIVVTFVSYYIAMNYEAKLNSLDREIIRIKTENQDLQADLDRYKSFNNVDNNVEKFNLLQKAEKVIEVTAMSSANTTIPIKKTVPIKYNWTIGY